VFLFKGEVEKAFFPSIYVSTNYMHCLIHHHKEEVEEKEKDERETKTCRHTLSSSLYDSWQVKQLYVGVIVLQRDGGHPHRSHETTPTPNDSPLSLQGYR